jgi:competence protein ComEC
LTLIYLSIAWVTGILLGAVWIPPTGIIACGAVPLILFPFLLHYRKMLLVSSLCLFAFFGGALYFQSTLTPVNEHQLRAYNNRGPIEIQGMVVTEPEISDLSYKFSLTAEKIYSGSEEKDISGKVLVYTSRYPEYHYGDVVKMMGEPETPERFADFDYGRYLASQGIYSTLYYPCIELLDHDKGAVFQSYIYKIRNSLSASLARILPEPQCSLARGILLGLRNTIPSAVNEMFSRTGTAHLLAISGLHLSIVTGFLLSAGIWAFGKRYYLYIWFALVAIWFYAALTGLRPPIVRGAIMGSMFLLAELLGRQRSAITALTFAAAVMVGINPLILWDPGFQLSFLAMTGLVFIYPKLRDRFHTQSIQKSFPASFTSRMYTATFKNLAITFAAILATLPVIAYHFGTISIVGIPATFFALPAVPFILIAAALAGILGLIVPVLGYIAGWFSWLFISYLIIVIKAFDALPFSSLSISGVTQWQIWLYYGLIASTLVLVYYKERLRNTVSTTMQKIRTYSVQAQQSMLSLPWKYAVPPLLIVAALVWAAAVSMPDDKLHVSVLDVGQGDAILIQTPNRQDILIDGGPDPQKLSLELGERLPFWDRTIELLVLTQPQADHLTGLIEIIKQYNVSQILEPPLTSDSILYTQWRELISEKNINHSIVCANQTIDLGNDIILELLNPSDTLMYNTSDDINNNSLVMRLVYDEVSFLLAADIEYEAEYNLIMQRANLNSTVLKIAHHGSNTSSTNEFLAVVDPDIAVISVGAKNRFNHPHPDVLNRINTVVGKERLYLTSQDGTVEFRTDGISLWTAKAKH